MSPHKPLLLCNTEVYQGPEVLVNGNGVRKVSVTGLQDGDEVAVELAGRVGPVREYAFTYDCDVDIAEEGFHIARARRVRSTGAEVSVWVE